MPRTFDGMVAWARNEAANGNVLDNWGGWCEKFINNSAAFNQAFGYAVVAGRNSGPLRTDYQNAGRGAIIYWAGVWIGGRENGHDAWVYEPGPDPLLLMASNAAKFPAWGHGIGLIRLSEYQRLFGHPLMGWTYRHGTETLNLSGTAGGGTTPIPTYSNGGNNMYFLRTVDGTVHFVTESGYEPIASVQHLSLLQRFVKAFPSFDTFNAAERDIIFGYIARARDITDAQYEAIVSGLNSVKVTVDSVAIGQAAAAEVAKYLAANGIEVDTAEIAAAVDEVLKDDFAAIPGAVTFGIGKELTD